MSSQTHYKKRSYSSVYKIYRRIRFVRYKRKAIKRHKLELKRKEIEERKEAQLKLNEFKLSEKEKQRIKQKADQEEAKRLRRELKVEFRQRDQLARQEWEKLTSEDKEKAKSVRLQEKKERKKEFRDDLKIRFKNFILSFRSLNIQTFKRKLKDFRENAPKRRRFALISFNSTVLFILAYLFLFLVSQAITVIAASFFNYPTTVYYYEIYFNIDPETWYHDSVKTIFSAGPLVNFVVGITFLIIYTNVREASGPFKLFFLWAFLHSVNMLFGALLVGTLFETGVGHVISWMYIMDTGKVLYSIISIFFLVIAGIISTKQFLISGNTYYNEINKNNRTSFILSQVFMPYLLGNIFLVLLRQPRFIFYDTFIGIALIICILPVFLTYRSYNELYFEEEEKKPGFTWFGIAILAVVILFFRGVLEIGIRFGG
jgi:hypothetical protein